MTTLVRRGFNLGDANTQNDTQQLSLERTKEVWSSGHAALLKGQFDKTLDGIAPQLRQTEQLVNSMLEEQSCDEILANQPYYSRLENRFESLGSVYNEGDEQEIEMVAFDATKEGEIIAEDLWLKASWLSFHDEDPSLRFRFSFGIDHEQDVASDPHRQNLAGQLTDAIFPESSVITDNLDLQHTLQHLLDGKHARFVERIIYFNAPNGGAYLHHDLERGHAGVVFAQLSGETFWLALPKQRLVEEIISFSKLHSWPESLTPQMRLEMSDLLCDRTLLSEQLDSFNNSTLIHLINETQAFVQFLINRGHSKHLEPGDILLLPQTSKESCCWHSVFCLGEEMGQALSFAIRAK